MKKILVSDYDGTIFEDDATTRKNIAAINKFRKKHIFVVATGRSYKDFLLAQEEYNLDCDYYLLNCGTQILDSNMNLIKKTPLTKADLKIITAFFKTKNTNIRYCSAIKNDDNTSQDIYKIIVDYEKSDELVEDYNQFIQIYNYHAFMLLNHCSIEILSENMSKSIAIKEISTREKCDKIYVIGDSKNDMDMITTYHGYCVEGATKEVKDVSTKVYPHVYNLIDELLEAD